jgi:ferredoxin
VRQLLRRLPFTPYACEILNAELAHVVTGARNVTALFRLGGNGESVAAQRKALIELGDPTKVDGDVWQRLATAEPQHAMVFRLSALPTAIEQVWTHATSMAAECPGTMIHATASRGSREVHRPVEWRVDRRLAPALRRVVVRDHANRRAASRGFVARMRTTADGGPPVERNQANVRSTSRAEYWNSRRSGMSAPVVVPPECALPNSPLSKEKSGIDACVHCGFCLQSCPTYLTLEDENDSPRGRIVLMRALLEGTLEPRNESVETHIGRCLGCRACETACPSGVPYGHLLEATRATLAEHRPIPAIARFILSIFERPWLLRLVFVGGRVTRALGIARLLSGLPGRPGFAMAMLASTSRADRRHASAPRSTGARGTGRIVDRMCDGRPVRGERTALPSAFSSATTTRWRTRLTSGAVARCTRTPATQTPRAGWRKPTSKHSRTRKSITCA